METSSIFFYQSLVVLESSTTIYTKKRLSTLSMESIEVNLPSQAIRITDSVTYIYDRESSSEQVAISPSKTMEQYFVSTAPNLMFSRDSSTFIYDQESSSEPFAILPSETMEQYFVSTAPNLMFSSDSSTTFIYDQESSAEPAAVSPSKSTEQDFVSTIPKQMFTSQVLPSGFTEEPILLTTTMALVTIVKSSSFAGTKKPPTRKPYKPSIYIGMSLRLTWKVFCSHLQEFKEGLAVLLAKKAGETFTSQVIVILNENGCQKKLDDDPVIAVSYTHLTLPTICSV